MWFSPIYRSPQDDNGYDISDYRDVDPLFGTLADLDEVIAALHERGIRRRDGPRGQSHQRRASVVRRVAIVEGLRPARLVLVAPGARGHGAGGTRRRADELGLSLLGPCVGARRGDGGVLPPPVQPQAARPQLGEPRRAGCRLRHDALVARPRRRRLPHGRDQPHLEGRRRGRIARRRRGRRRAASATAACRRSTARACTSSCRRCTARCSTAAAKRCCWWARRPAPPSRTAACSPTPPATSSTWSSRSSTCTSTTARAGGSTCAPSTCASSRRRWRAGSTGCSTPAGTRCTGRTTISPAASRASATTARTGASRRRCSPRCCTCTAARRTSTRARSSA